MNGRWGNSRRVLIWYAAFYVFLLSAHFTSAQTPSPALLVLEKSDNMLVIVDPANLQVVARVPAGPDPHEIVASADGKLAYISNYGGNDSALNTISVVDLAARKILPPISLGPLRSTHGLAFAGGKLYFTAETNKVIGRYDPATQSVDWVLGTGQDRTHMVVVNENLDRIVTSNVSSGTVSLIELVSLPTVGFGQPRGNPSGNTFVAGFTPATADTPPGGPPPGMGSPPANPRQTWRVTNVAAGRGAEGFDVSPDGKEIWAANAQDATVTIIDIASKKVTDTVPGTRRQPAEVYSRWQTGLNLGPGRRRHEQPGGAGLDHPKRGHEVRPRRGRRGNRDRPGWLSRVRGCQWKKQSRSRRFENFGN